MIDKLSICDYYLVDVAWFIDESPFCIKVENVCVEILDKYVASVWTSLISHLLFTFVNCHKPAFLVVLTTLESNYVSLLRTKNHLY